MIEKLTWSRWLWVGSEDKYWVWESSRDLKYIREVKYMGGIGCGWRDREI